MFLSGCSGDFYLPSQDGCMFSSQAARTRNREAQERAALPLDQLCTRPRGGAWPGESSCDPCHEEEASIKTPLKGSVFTAPPNPPELEVPLNYVLTERAPSSRLPGTGGCYFSTTPSHCCSSWKGPLQLNQRGMKTAQQPKTEISVVFHRVASGTPCNAPLSFPS